MSPVQVIALVVRLFAIWLVAYALFELRWAFSAEDFVVTKSLIVIVTFLVAAAFVLWRFPIMIASRIVPDYLDTEKTVNWSMEELYCCGIVLAGFLFLFWSVSDATYWLAVGIAASRDTTGEWAFTIEHKAAMVTTVAEIAIGFSLIFGARGWQRLIYRLRFGKETDRSAR